MRVTFLGVFVALAIVVGVSADQIIKTDGSVIRDVRIVSINIKEVTYREGSRAKNIPSYKVQDFKPENPPRLMKNALNNLADEEFEGAMAGFNTFIERTNPKSNFYWMVQLAFWKRSQVCFNEGTVKGFSDGFAELEALNKKLPDNFYLYHEYQLRMDYYLSKAKIGNKYLTSALGRNLKWQQTIKAKELPNFFLFDAQLDQLMVEVRFKKIKPDAAMKKLATLIKQTSSVKRAQNRAKSQLARIYLLSQQLGKAKELFDELVDVNEIADTHRAMAWLGKGQIISRKKGATREDFKEAFLCFMRVYGIFNKGGKETGQMRETIAEALYWAELELPKWAPQATAKTMRRQIFIRRRTTYRATLFGSKR